jgi:amino acid permease
MFSYIDKVRKQDSRTKTRTSLVASIVITGIIAIIWGFFFLGNIQSKTKNTDTNPSIFKGMLDDIKKTLQNNPFKGE